MFRWFRRKTSPPLPQTGVRCSFCNKSSRMVKKVIAGPSVFICDECVGICVDILSHERNDQPPRPASVPVWCSLCLQLIPISNMTNVPRRGYVCRDCVDAIRELP